jgi:hypothetical protein
LDAGDEDGGGAGGASASTSSGGTGGGSGGAPASTSTGGTGGGSGGTGGHDAGTPPDSVAAYGSCAQDGDCMPAGSACLTDPSGLLGSACQPPCKAKKDCPVPPGSYSAVVTCTADKLCVLDCSPGSDLTPGTCPGNLGCMALIDGTFACLSQ